MVPVNSTDQHNATSGSHPGIRVVASVLLIVAVGWFTYRGPVRAVTPGTGTDLELIQSAARAFARGLNPYSIVDVRSVWPSGPENAPNWRSNADLLYPPTTWAMLIPLSQFSLYSGRLIWVALNCLSIGVVILALLRLSGLTLGSPHGKLLTATILAFAPIHSALVLGQLSLVTLALIAAGHWARVSSRPVIAGVLFGLATALKPQLGLVFLAYEAFRLRWKSTLSGALALVLIAGASIGWMEYSHVVWGPALAQNVHDFIHIAGGDPTIANPMRYQLINLHYPLHSIIQSRQIVTTLVWASVGGGALAYFLIWMRRRDDRTELLTLSMACPLALLLVYHRVYDAVMLLLPVAWAIGMLQSANRTETSNRRIAWLALVMTSAFLLPTSAILHALEQRGTIPAGFVDTIVYQLVIQPHQVWAMIGLSLMLIFALWKQPARPPAIWNRQGEHLEQETTTDADHRTLAVGDYD